MVSGGTSDQLVGAYLSLNVTIMRFRVTFQFRGTASGFPTFEDVYAESETSARQLAEKLAANKGWRVLEIKKVD